jgi:hypothetical protein
MKIWKKRLANLDWAYATLVADLSGEHYLIGLSENRDREGYLFSPPKWEKSVLWEKPSGVMNIVQLPGTSRLFTITDFYPIFRSENACVQEVTPTGDYKNLWNISQVLSIPYAHRIGLLKIDRIYYMIVCSLCESKSSQEDWSKPGGVFVSPVPSLEHSGIWPVKKIYHGLTKNHGLFIYNNNQVYITAEEGIFYFDFANYDFDSKINPLHISKIPTSDIFINDIDNDGFPEVGTIEPFHGNLFVLYRMIGNELRPLYRFEINFGHVVWLGNIFGIPSIITASRGGNKELTLYQNKTKKLENNCWDKILIDSGTGTTQISLFFEEKEAFIFAANHEMEEFALYTLHR